MSIVCEYCNASNPDKEKQCVACGAPLSKKSIQTTRSQNSKPAVEKKGQSVETARKVANVYSSIWLAIFDSIIIAAVALAVGLTGGIVGQPVLGVLGAASVGFAVSISIKNGLATIISAPAGIVLGSILCIIAMLVHLPVFLFPVLLTICTVFTSMFGRQKVPYEIRTTWQKIRPYLGSIGGLIFGLLGMGLGMGLQVVYTNLVQFLQ